MKKIQFKTISILGWIVFSLIGIGACRNQPDHSPESIIKGETGNQLEKTLSPYIENIISSYELPGLSVGIVKDNEIVYAKAFGYVDVETKKPASIQSLYHLASISKLFVATAVMQLAEQGKIDLDSPVIAYLPYFKLTGGPYEKITIRQMLSHVSGMPDEDDYEWDDPVYDDGALERYVRGLSSEKMLSIPGERFAYSNTAFECLGDVIAKVSGMSFADYEKKQVLDPAGMKESTFLKPERLPENWAAPHLRIFSTVVWQGYPYNRMHEPSSTLHSNVLEMGQWAIINMNHGTYRNRRILDAASYEILWKPWVKIGADNHIGLGWFIGKYGGEKTVEHGGSDTGFNTIFIMLPEKSIAVAVLCNYNPAPVRAVANAALDILLGFEPGTFRTPAGIPVGKKLETEGVDAAAELWNSLRRDHPDQYDFNPRQFLGLLLAMQMDLAEAAESLTRLCLKIFPEDVIRYIEKEAETSVVKNPNNKAAPAMLKAIREK